MSDAFLSALHADPWNETLVDLEDLNREASATIEAKVSELNREAQESPANLRTSSLVVLGPPGTGKTHLFSRLRKHLGPRAVFVHMRPLLHAGLTPSFVLREAVIQLGQASYQQLQADALVGSLIAQMEGHSADFPRTFLSQYQDMTPEERQPRLESLVDRLLETFPDLDETFADRLLQLPFCEPRKRRALLAWMSGEDCDPSQLSRVGANSSMNPENAVRALRTLGCIAAVGAPLVLVFDQLENLIQRDAEEQRVTQYGNLIAELVDATRGLLVVQMALDSEWQQGIEPRLNLSQKSRVVMNKVAINLPTPTQSRGLLELWHGRFEQPEQDYPWPLTLEQVKALVEIPGLTPRMLLSALREGHQGVVPALLRPIQGADSGREPDAAEVEQEAEERNSLLEEEWHTRLVGAHLHIDQSEGRRSSIDARRLCDGILLASQFATGLSLRAGKNRYIQIEAESGGGPWLCFLEQAHPRSVGAALDRALGKDSTEPGLVVRELWRSFPPTWKSTVEKQMELIARPHVTWHELPREEAASLLALEEMLQMARSRDICDARGRPFEEEQVLDFLRAEIRPEQWPLVVRLNGIDEIAPESRSSVEIAALDHWPLEESEEPAFPVQVDGALSQEAHLPDAETIVSTLLRRLRVASVDRLIRESHRADATMGRTQVASGLEALGGQVRWFGRNIVAWGAES